MLGEGKTRRVAAATGSPARAASDDFEEVHAHAVNFGGEASLRAPLSEERTRRRLRAGRCCGAGGLLSLRRSKPPSLRRASPDRAQRAQGSRRFSASREYEVRAFCTPTTEAAARAGAKKAIPGETPRSRSGISYPARAQQVSLPGGVAVKRAPAGSERAPDRVSLLVEL